MAPRYYFATIDSTQREAVRRVREGDPVGTTVVARAQTAGLGRADHSWSSPPGGLYLSLVTGHEPAASPLYPLAIGVELHRMLRAQYSVDTTVKWPNDVGVESTGARLRKLAGTLVDRISFPGQPPRDVVGIGLNANSSSPDFPWTLRATVATLRDLRGAPVDLAGLERSVVDSVHRAVERIGTRAGRAKLITELSAVLYGRGRAVTVDGVPGGVLSGVTEDGAAELLDSAGRHALFTGELAVVEGE